MGGRGGGLCRQAEPQLEQVVQEPTLRSQPGRSRAVKDGSSHPAPTLCPQSTEEPNEKGTSALVSTLSLEREAGQNIAPKHMKGILRNIF